MDLSKIKAIIFDYGGTLDTNARHWSHVLWDGYRKACVSISNEQFKEAYVFAERELAKNRIILPQDNFLDLLRKKIEIEIQYLSQTHYWDVDSSNQKKKKEEIAQFCYDYVQHILIDSRRILSAVSLKYTTVLVSNFYGNIQAVLSDFHLNYFSSIIESSVVGVRKPNPRIFELGVEATRCNAEEVLVIGDSFGKDILPAHSIGCKTIWMKGEGWSDKEEYDESIPDGIIHEISDLSFLA